MSFRQQKAIELSNLGWVKRKRIGSNKINKFHPWKLDNAKGSREVIERKIKLWIENGI